MEIKHITYREWIDRVMDLARYIDAKQTELGKPFTGVFGVPRGGTLISLLISEYLKLPLLTEPILDCVVVDDLIDSGQTKQKYANYDFYALYEKKGQWLEFWYEETSKDFEAIVTRQIEAIGDDAKRDGLKGTPERVVRMWTELFRGYDESRKPKLTVFENGKDGLQYDSVICDTGDFYSQCEHHMVPFFGKYYFAYIPDKKILGLSKVARVVDYYSAKLQIQERLCKEIVDYIEQEVQPLGIALIMKGEHLCKTMRGSKKKGQMTTSVMRGVFRTDATARAEFLNLIKMQ